MYRKVLRAFATATLLLLPGAGFASGFTTPPLPSEAPRGEAPPAPKSKPLPEAHEVKAKPAEHAAKAGAPAEEKAVETHAAPAAHASSGHAEPAERVYPAEALKELLAGNKRFAVGATTGPHRSVARRAEVAGGQAPIAVIVSCSDSRVPPEVVFDQGIGDLFVVRTAGEVVDDAALGSIEYAVGHLNVTLVLVLGHERCGAVKATLEGGHAPGAIAKIVEAIKPAVDAAKGREGDELTNCIRVNTKMIAEKLRAAQPILAEKVKDGELRVVGGFYDLDTGVVTINYNPDLTL